MKYRKYETIVDELKIFEGDVILLSSDVTNLAIESHLHGDYFDGNRFIDSIVEKIGEAGTLLIPTYNWDFCSGKTFEYFRTPCKTGSLGRMVLKRSDFKRTKHPIYSFAVWGKDKDMLCTIDNRSSFGYDSPFGYLFRNNGKNLVIDVRLVHCFTFLHFVEQQIGNISYRYEKDFTSGYIDELGVYALKTYSMFVRNLDMNVVTINDFEDLFLSAKAEEISPINNVDFKLVDLRKTYKLIENDIVNNRSRSLCRFSGQ